MKTSRSLARSQSKGFTLIELLIYTGILILLVAVVGSTLLSIGRTYRSVAASQAVESTGQQAMGRMVQEIRNATSIDVGGSVFNSAAGQLSLNTTDQNDVAQVVQFFLTGQTLHVREKGIDKGPLSPAAAHITSLMFRSITTSHSKAVKIEMTVESGTSTAYHVQTFYDTALLRPSYAN